MCARCGLGLVAGLSLFVPMPALAMNAEVPTGSTAAVPEGAEPGPTLDEAWQARDRKLRTATLVTGGLAGAAAIGTATAVGLRLAHGGREHDGSDESKALIGTGVIFGVAAVGLTIAGGLWELHRERRLGVGSVNQRGMVQPFPIEASVSPSGVANPRGDPGWLRRDRRLTTAMQATGAAAGVALAGSGISLGFLFGSPYSDDNTGEVVGTISMAAITGILAIPFTAIAVTRGVHRRPLRKWKASLAGGGLRIEF